MSELPPCKLCGAAAISWNGLIGCGTFSCKMRAMPYLNDSEWLRLMSDTAPDWARRRETTKEKPTGTYVVAFDAAYNRWDTMLSSSVDSHPSRFTHWHHIAPVPKEPSKFEKWGQARIQCQSSRDEWNAACDLLGKPQEKV